MLGEYHQQTPDLDNLIKALGDAMYSDDSHIARICATKVWAEDGFIEILGEKDGSK
jgi:Holliday junction resolvase RusA-like endonuclease